jgi:hypothetical protein
VEKQFVLFLPARRHPASAHGCARRAPCATASEPWCRRASGNPAPHAASTSPLLVRRLRSSSTTRSQPSWSCWELEIPPRRGGAPSVDQHHVRRPQVACRLACVASVGPAYCLVPNLHGRELGSSTDAVGARFRRQPIVRAMSHSLPPLWSPVRSFTLVDPHPIRRPPVAHRLTGVASATRFGDWRASSRADPPRWGWRDVTLVGGRDLPAMEDGCGVACEDSWPARRLGMDPVRQISRGSRIRDMERNGERGREDGGG